MGLVICAGPMMQYIQEAGAMSSKKSKMHRFTELKDLEKVVIAKYIRVSTDKQREEGYSVDIQKERLDGYVKSVFPRTEFEVEYREYVDDGYSGGSLDRPRMNDLIQDVKNGEVTHVVVLKLDRLSRSQKDTLYLIEDVFLPHGVAFISMGESFNTATAFGRAVVGILSVFAQLERENIYERTRSGMQKRVEEGYWPGGGRVPYGYDYDREQGILIPNPHEAQMVQMVFDLYLKGYAMQTIAEMCGINHEKIVYGILTRKTNLGLIVYNDVEYQGRHQAIISPELYQKAQAMMKVRSNRKLVTATEHLFTGLIRCGKCGAKMRYQKWGKNGDKLVCYSQQPSKPNLVHDPNCDNTRPWARDVEEVVMDVVFGRARQVLLEEVEAGAVTYDALQALENKRNELVRKLNRLYDLYAGGDDGALATIQKLKGEIHTVDEQIALEEDNASVSEVAKDAHKKLSTMADSWEYMTTVERRNIMKSVIREITVTGDHIHIDFNY